MEKALLQWHSFLRPLRCLIVPWLCDGSWEIIKFAEKEILPEVGQELKLDEPVDELGGLTMRDAIDSFTGEFLLSLTDAKMPDPSAMGGLPGGPPADTETDPFGNDALTPGEADPLVIRTCREVALLFPVRMEDRRVEWIRRP